MDFAFPLLTLDFSHSRYSKQQNCPSSSPFCHQLTPVNFLPPTLRNVWPKATLTSNSTSKLSSQYSLFKVADHFSFLTCFFHLVSGPPPFFSFSHSFSVSSSLFSSPQCWMWQHLWMCYPLYREHTPSNHTHSLKASASCLTLNASKWWWHPKDVSPAWFPLFRLIGVSTYLKSLNT